MEQWFGKRGGAIWGGAAVVALLAIVFSFRIVKLEGQFHSLADEAGGMDAAAEEQRRAIRELGAETKQSLKDFAASELVIIADEVVGQQRSSLKAELDKLVQEIDESRAELRAAEENRNRALAELPKKVDLDDLSAYYAGRWDQTQYGPVESFQTARGPITFGKADFTFAYLPSSGALAWVQIGKSQSAENAELIKAWLAEAADAKVQQGYVREYVRTRPSDYGEFTEALYRKGDMYLKTYYQYERILETYGRHSHRYRYYLEMGAESRRRQYRLEEYNQKTGS